MTTTDPRYPIGPFTPPTRVSPAERAAFADRIGRLPERLRASVVGLNDAQLDTPYRDGGWTVRQVVHHVCDSHLNALIRFKLGLTEERPVVRPYDENTWLTTADATETSLEDALAFVDTLHRRLAAIAHSLDDVRGARELVHPESGVLTLDQLLATYAWHGDHHVAHITRLRERCGW